MGGFLFARIRRSYKLPNKNLTQAKKAKNDEFYTQLTDIEKELSHYTKHFKDKVVLCNCDDPFESNFFRYFVLNFNRLGIKKLITTSYAGSPIAYRQLNMFDYVDGVAPDGRKRAYKAEVTVVHGKTATSGYNMDDIANLFVTGENKLELLEGDGDFRSQECLDILDEADIVVSNPPFSLWREYISTLVSHGKKFVIVGNKNAVTYKEVFPLIQNNQLWIGVRSINSDFWLMVPYGAPYEKIGDNGTYLKHIMACWFTNLDIKKRHEELILVKQYHGHEDEYPHYDNYDAINVDKVVDIPCDYDGVMGVPITFLDKYNPEQFEIVGLGNGAELFGPTKTYKNVVTMKNGKAISNGNAVNRVLVWKLKELPIKGTYYRLETGELLFAPYARILIRSKINVGEDN
jgi:hypothetical protein